MRTDIIPIDPEAREMCAALEASIARAKARKLAEAERAYAAAYEAFRADCPRANARLLQAAMTLIDAYRAMR